MAEDPVAPIVPAALELDHGRAVVDRCAEAVDRGDARDDDHVPPLEERTRGVVPQPVDLLVAGRVLLDVRIGPGEVGLRLEVVVVADEVLDRVLREELLELLVELGGEGLVVRHDQRRLLDGLDDLGGGERLPRARRAEQHLVAKAALDAVRQLGDRRRLVAGRLVGGVDLQVGHGTDDSSRRPSVPPSRSQRPISAPFRPSIGSVAAACPERRSSARNPNGRSDSTVSRRWTLGERPPPRHGRPGDGRVRRGPPAHAPDRGWHRPVRAPVRRERDPHECCPRGRAGRDDHPVRSRLHASDERRHPLHGRARCCLPVLRDPGRRLAAFRRDAIRAPQEPTSTATATRTAG